MTPLLIVVARKPDAFVTGLAQLLVVFLAVVERQRSARELDRLGAGGGQLLGGGAECAR